MATLHHHYVSNGYKPRCCVPWAQLRQTCQCHQCRAARGPADPVRNPIPWALLRETCPCKRCRLYRGEDEEDDEPAEAVPAETVPAETVPTETVPAETVPRPPCSCKMCEDGRRPMSPRSRRRKAIFDQFVIPGYPVPSWLQPLLEM